LNKITDSDCSENSKNPCKLKENALQLATLFHHFPLRKLTVSLAPVPRLPTSPWFEGNP
jgi:hypothetical protein